MSNNERLNGYAITADQEVLHENFVPDTPHAEYARVLAEIEWWEAEDPTIAAELRRSLITLLENSI